MNARQNSANQSPVTLDDVMDETVRVAESASVIEQLSRAEIDIQIATAKKWPRSLVAFRRQAEELATWDTETAASCYYRLKQGGQWVEGPSVRMAEIVQSTYGNFRSHCRVVGETEKVITAQGFAFDLEKNSAITIEVARRITKSDGSRYSDDMVVKTGNAAQSIALRNAIFRVVPKALIKTVIDAAKEVALGKGKTMEQRRAEFLGWYTKRGAQEAQVLEMLGRAGVEEITVDDLHTLRGLCTAIKDGEITLAAALEPPDRSRGRSTSKPARTLADLPAADRATPPPATSPDEYVTTDDIPPPEEMT